MAQKVKYNLPFDPECMSQKDLTNQSFCLQATGHYAAMLLPINLLKFLLVMSESVSLSSSLTTSFLLINFPPSNVAD